MWQPHIPSFSQHFRVIAPDSRGHGKTNNPTGEFSYRLMAMDIAVFVQTLGLTKPLICGYSDGGQIALEIGMRYPNLTKALVIGPAWNNQINERLRRLSQLIDVYVPFYLTTYKKLFKGQSFYRW